MRTGFCLLIVAALFLALTPVPRAADQDVIQPFDGRTLNGWKFKNEKESEWTVGRAIMDEKDPKKLVVTPLDPPIGGSAAPELVNNKSTKRGTDLYTEQKFGDCLIELEFMVSKGSNSGVYVMGEYEIQILDSYGRDKVGPGDLGGLYGAAPPRLNASKKPGEWQKFVIDFTAPKFEDGKKTANAKFNRITLNGEVIHENVEMKGVTPTGVTGKEAPTGPLMFQGDHGPVAFRNIRITPR